MYNHGLPALVSFTWFLNSHSCPCLHWLMMSKWSDWCSWWHLPPETLKADCSYSTSLSSWIQKRYLYTKCILVHVTPPYCPNPALAAVFDSMPFRYLSHTVMVIRLASSPSPVVCCYLDTSLVCSACHSDFASIILWDLFTSTDMRSFVLLLLGAMLVCTSSVSLALFSELVSIDNA